MSEKKRNIMSPWVPFLAVGLGMITFLYVTGEFADPVSDYNGHVHVYIPLLLGDNLSEGWMSIPYFLWHLVTIFFHKITEVPIEPAAALSSSVFAVFSFGVLYYMIQKYCESKNVKISVGTAACLAFCLCIIQGIILPWVGRRGDFTVNPLHNPTQMCVKPFSLLCFAFTYDIFQKLKDSSHKGIFISMESGMKKAYISLMIVLFFSGMAKPTFAEMFIPAVGLMMLGGWGYRLYKKDGTAKAYFIELVKMFLVAVPTLGYIFLQFLAYFVWGGSYGLEESHIIITSWMEVWKMFSDNIPISIMMTMAFPLLIVMLDLRFFLKDYLGRIALVGYGVGLLEAGFLSEADKMSHGDFLWPMMSGMLLMWVAALLRFLELYHACNEGTAVETGKGWLDCLRRFLLQTCWFVFALFVCFAAKDIIVHLLNLM